MLRGIQILGLIIAVLALTFIAIARKKKRFNARFFLFWVLFWCVFLVIDLYPSLAVYFQPVLALETNMFILTAASVFTLFILVFALYSVLSDLNQKVTTLVRAQAILNNKVTNLGARDNGHAKEDSDSNTSS